MLNLKLSAMVYLTGHLEALSKATGLTESELEQLLFKQSAYAVFKTDGNGNLTNEKPLLLSHAELNCSTFESENVTIAENTVLAFEKLTGIAPIREVNIPYEVFRVCDAYAWYDICNLFHRIEGRNKRYKQLQSYGAPTIIIQNEYRMLVEAVQGLENNALWIKPNEPLHNGLRLRRENGFVMRSLNSAGYSLINGWGDNEAPEVTEEA